MRHLFLFSVLLSCSTSVCAQTPSSQWEAQIAYEMTYPSGAMWDKGHSAEVKAIYWQTSDIGFGFFTGLSQWDAAPRTTQVNQDITRSWGGDAQYIPLGIAVLNRRDLDMKKLHYVTWEASVSYLFCDSNIHLTETVQIPIGAGQTLTKVDVYQADSTGAFVARLAANFEWNLDNKQSTFFLTGGYQFDLDKGKASVDTLLVSESLKLTAFFIKLGLAVPF